MKEAGLTGFMHAQQVKGVLGMVTPLAKQFLQVRGNGDPYYARWVEYGTEPHRITATTPGGRYGCMRDLNGEPSCRKIGG